MKKIYYILIGLIIITMFVLIFTFSKESNIKDVTTIKVAEVTHSAFYTPFYVAIKNNYFKDNNIKFTLVGKVGDVFDKENTYINGETDEKLFSNLNSILTINFFDVK